MALKDFDYKTFLLQKGEWIGLFTAVGIMVILLILGPVLMGIGSTGPNSADAKAKDIKDLSARGRNALSTDAPQEIVAVHVVSPQELDPAQLGTGEARLIDSESGHEIELLIDGNVLDGYRTAYAAWQERLRQQITNQLGRYLPVRSDTSLNRLLLHDWRRLGLIN